MDSMHDAPMLWEHAVIETSDTQVVNDSDDEEGLEHLAGLQEDAYWNLVDASLSGTDIALALEAGDQPNEGDKSLIETGLDVHPQTHVETNVSHTLPLFQNAYIDARSSSPDPLNLPVGQPAPSPATPYIGASNEPLTSSHDPAQYKPVHDFGSEPTKVNGTSPNDINIQPSRRLSDDLQERRIRRESASSDDLPSLSEIARRSRQPQQLQTRRSLSPASLSSDDSDVVQVTTRSARIANAEASIVPEHTQSSVQPERPFSPVLIDSQHPENETQEHAAADLPLSERSIDVVHEEENQHGARALRKRTAVQLNPYTTEFSRFANHAMRNQWGGIIITDGLNLHGRTETPEERAARKQAQKQRPVDDLGGWLELDSGQRPLAQHETENAGIAVQSRRLDAENESDGPAAVKRASPYSSSESESGDDMSRGRGRHPSSNGNEILILDLPSPQQRRYKDEQRRKRRKRRKYEYEMAPLPEQSTSAVTVEDAIAARKAAARKKSTSRSGPSTEASRYRQDGGRTLSSPMRAGSEPPSSSPVRIVTGRSRSSSHDAALTREYAPVSGKRKRDSGHRRSRQFDSDEMELVEDSHPRNTIDISDEESDSSVAHDGESPERPRAEAIPDDRFALAGKRKRAIRGMMPAAWVKKAEKDLELMRKEKKSGRIRQEIVELDDNDENGAPNESDDPAVARVRINRSGARRPIRFIGDQTTSESDSAPDPEHGGEDDESEIEIRQAAHTWANQTSIKQSSKSYWNNVIGKILMRGEASSVSRLRRRKTKRPSSRVSSKNSQLKHAEDRSRQSQTRPKQSRLDVYYVPPVHLNTDEALFSALPIRNEFHGSSRNLPRRPKEQNDGSKLNPLPVQSVHQAPTTPLSTATAHSEAWKTQAVAFSRFSFDFGLQRLPVGIVFAPHTFIGKGHLHETLSHAEPDQGITPENYSCSPFGIHLDGSMCENDFMTFLPRLCEQMYCEITSLPVPVSLSGSVVEVLFFVSRYAFDVGKVSINTRETILGELAKTSKRLEQWIELTAAEEQNWRDLIQALLPWNYLNFTLSYRNYLDAHVQEQPVSSHDAAAADVASALGQIVRKLLALGLKRTAATLRALVNAEHREHVDELTCEIWVALIHMCSTEEGHASRKLLTHGTLWRTISEHLHQNAQQTSIQPILLNELACHTAITLSALSQFGQTGLCRAEPCLSSHWDFITDALDAIKPSELHKQFPTMSSTNRRRTSRYLWCLFARCLTMSGRWLWPILPQTRLFGKLFDILNARELQDLSIDGEPSYPSFLSAPAASISPTVETDDTIFTIFLRMLAKAATESRTSGDKSSGTMFTRLAMRVIPMREALSYPRTVAPGIIRKHKSILINHYSIYVLLAIVDPSTAEKRLPRFKALLNFSASDKRARQECVKAILLYGLAWQRNGISNEPLLSWLGDLCDELRVKYLGLARQRNRLLMPLSDHTSKLAAREKNGATSARTAVPLRQADLQPVNAEMTEVALLAGLVIGCAGTFLTSATDGEFFAYPDLAYLNTAWTTAILESPMAHDPVVGSQILQLLRNYCDARKKHVASRPRTVAQSESQDEYGDVDFDYDDPALTAVLGLVPAVTSTEPSEKTANDGKQKDLAYAEFVRDHLSPAVYRLLSNIHVTNLGQQTGVPDIPDRSAYVSDLVEVWVLSVAATVQNGLRDWSYYMGEFGKESWHRIGDVKSRYEIGLHFARTMLHADPASLQPFRDELVEILIRMLATATDGPAVATFLTDLLNADMDFILWQRLPFSTDAVTGAYDVSANAIKRLRLPILRTIFRNCKLVLTAPAPGIGLADDVDYAAVLAERISIDKINRTLIHRWLGAMLAAMRDYHDGLKSKRDLTGLGVFTPQCQEIISALIVELGPSQANERTLPQLRLLAGIINEM